LGEEEPIIKIYCKKKNPFSIWNKTLPALAEALCFQVCGELMGSSSSRGIWRPLLASEGTCTHMHKPIPRPMHHGIEVFKKPGSRMCDTCFLTTHTHTHTHTHTPWGKTLYPSGFWTTITSHFWVIVTGVLNSIPTALDSQSSAFVFLLWFPLSHLLRFYPHLLLDHSSHFLPSTWTSLDKLSQYPT
jgi:hypothetical protein